MKIVILPEFTLTTQKPQCLTCKYRGNIHTAYDPFSKEQYDIQGFPEKVVIKEFHCMHPTSVLIYKKPGDICEKFESVHPVLNRLFSVKKIL